MISKFSKSVLFASLVAFVTMASAATIDLTVGDAGKGYAVRDSGNTFVVEKYANVSDWAGVGTNVVQLLKVGSGTVVHAVGYQVITATTNGASFTLDLGDGDDDDGYIAAGTSTGGAYRCSSPGTLTAANTWSGTNVTTAITVTPAYGMGKFYSVNDTIDGVWNSLTADTTTGRVRVWAVLSDGRNK